MAKASKNNRHEMNYSPVKGKRYTKTALRSVKPFESDLDYIQMELEWLKLRCERFYYRNDEGQLNQRNRWHQDEEDNPDFSRFHSLPLNQPVKTSVFAGFYKHLLLMPSAIEKLNVQNRIKCNNKKQNVVANTVCQRKEKSFYFGNLEFSSNDLIQY